MLKLGIQKGMYSMPVLVLFSIFFLSSNESFAFSKKHLERLKSKKDITYGDLAHEHIGCPESSECSAQNGLKIKQWLKILSAYNKDPKVLATAIERYRVKQGIPVTFLAYDTKQLKQSVDPVIWDSRCRHHSVKGKTKIIKGMKFFRNNPKSKDIIFTNVKMGKKNFKIPYGDQPLLIWKGGLIIIKDYDDYLYHLSISTNGKWKVKYVPAKIIKKGRISKSSVQCKERPKTKPNEYFLGSYCSKIWNEDKKDYEIIEQQWACP